MRMYIDECKAAAANTKEPLNLNMLEHELEAIRVPKGGEEMEQIMREFCSEFEAGFGAELRGGLHS